MHRGRPEDFSALLDLVKYEWIDLTIVGPEDPLSKGIVDVFEKEGRKILGPTKAAAMLESSKVFSKDLMSPIEYRPQNTVYSLRICMLKTI